MNNSTGSQIFNMVTQEWNAIHDEIQDALEINDEYQSKVKDFDFILDSLEIDNKIKTQIKDYVVAIETPTKEESYSKGFADAIKLMTACFQVK